MGRSLGLAWMVASLTLLVACDGDPVVDAGMDAGALDSGTDAGPPPIALAGLDGPVEVVVDDRGMPHIYASTVHDLQMVQGYLMSRDRFVQMELIRRNVTGQLAAVLGTLSPGLLQDDRDQRFLGFRRQGQAIYDSLPADDETRLVAEAFVEGINAYIDEVVDTDEYVPSRGNELINLIRASDSFGHWSPADIFAIARFQSYSLSYDAGADISRTRALAGVRDAFGAADPGGDEMQQRLAARAGIFADFWSERQARNVYTRDGFNDGTTEAFLPPTTPITRPIPRPIDGSPARLPSAALLAGGQRFFDRVGENPFLRDAEHIGSNSWVVSGEHTASGNPILSNDPHLSLISPPIWWYVHLNTVEMGGDIDASGVAFAALPGVVLGYNRHLAWSATTTGYDVTDIYEEEVTYRNDGTPAAPAWVPVSVRYMGADVALDTITEVITLADQSTEDFLIYDVPHHGPLIIDTYVEPTVVDPPAGSTATGSALSVRYTGHDVSNELAFFTRLLTATSVDEAFDAADAFQVGAQNFSFVSSSGDIGWTTHSRIPQRSAAACSFEVATDGTITGASPLFVLPGDGTAEWGEDLSPAFIPHDVNPARGYIATANQANVSVTEDGNPCNDAHYIGGDFAVGYRQGRIVERLDALTARGDITTADMIDLQAETRSSLGETLRDPLVAAIDHALSDPSDDAALSALVTGAGADGASDLTDVRARLMAWTFETPHGVGSSDDAEIADSVATAVFNATITRLTNLAFDDESALIGRGPGSSQRARMLEWALATPAAQQALPLYTFRADYAGVTGWNDTVVWDDVSTDAVVETRDERVVRAVLAAVAWLEETLGADRDEWRWGRLHAVRFQQLVEPVVDEGVVSIPERGSEQFPLGFPRHGDFGAVDVGNFSMSGGTGFTHGSGASQRLVVEMTPDGPIPFNALPGGQSEDTDSPHHADEAELWRNNQQPAMVFDRAAVDARAEERLRFTPG